jgi:TolB protein
MTQLTILRGPQAGQQFQIDRPAMRIGRGSGSDVVIGDSQASRQHAEITRSGDDVFIRDLDSTNGTFVNGQQVTGMRQLYPGDEIRIGQTVFRYQPAAAGPATTPAWGSDLYDEGTAGYPVTQERGRQPLIWGLAALVAVLVVAAIVVAVLLLGGGGDGTATPVAGLPTDGVVASPTPTPEPTQPETAPGTTSAPAESTATLIVAVDTPVPAGTSVPIDTVAAPTTAPQQPAQPPAQSPPLSPEELEQLPAAVTEYLGNIPPEQLPEAIAAQVQSMSQEQMQEMIGALFPGVDPTTLPQVVAASFPGLSTQDVEGLMNMAFPGQNIQIPEMGPVGGQLILGSYDQGRDVWDLYTINALGDGRALVVEEASEPDFSPDGEWIVYYSWKPDRLGLRLIKTDGTGDTTLTTAKVHYYPSFSPDGGRIAFHNSDTNAVDVINRDGSNLREITKGEFPAWSPVGDQIVYRGCLGGGRCGLIVANADGTNPRQITTHANDAAPRWSPNGGQITFHSDRDGNWEIYVINVDGSWLRRITINPTTDIMPVWSPDGLRIAFRSDRGGQQAVWVTSGIGGPATKLLDAGFEPAYPNLARMDWR